MSAEVSQEQVDAFVGACHGNLQAVRDTLAEHPELINSRSSLGESPLGAAAHVGNREIAEYLLTQGADLDICAAAMLGDIDAVRGYLEADAGLAASAGAHGIAVLFHAVVGGDIGIAELLVENGADVVSVTGPESAALNMAAARGHVAMARWLLDRGASTNVTDFQGKTALERAEEAGHDEIAEMLRVASA